MMRGVAPLVLSATVAWLGCTGCATCDRAGCDALSQRASDSSGESRVAGVVASESDVVGNGCQECQFAAASLQAWATSESVTTEAELRSATMGSASANGAAAEDGHYALSLEAGRYVVCVQSNCFNVEVSEGRTTTLNVRLINGISSGFVGLPDQRDLERVDAMLLPPN